jgi:hypothetical protein
MADIAFRVDQYDTVEILRFVEGEGSYSLDYRQALEFQKLQPDIDLGDLSDLKEFKVESNYGIKSFISPDNKTNLETISISHLQGPNWSTAGSLADRAVGASSATLDLTGVTNNFKTLEYKGNYYEEGTAVTSVDNPSLSARSQTSEYNASAVNSMLYTVGTFAALSFSTPGKNNINAGNYTEYLQIDLGEEKIASGIVTQGRADVIQYVTSYFVKHSTDGTNFSDVDNGNVFVGNTSNVDTVTNTFTTAVLARYIRIYPTGYHSYPSIRAGVQISTFDLAAVKLPTTSALDPFKITGLTDVLASTGLTKIELNNIETSANLPTTLPVSTEQIIIEGDKHEIDGAIPNIPTNLTHMRIIGNNNEITGSIPSSLNSGLKQYRIVGAKCKFSGSNFITEPVDGLEYYTVNNPNPGPAGATGFRGSHTSALPAFSESESLIAFDFTGCKLTGNLPADLSSLCPALKIFKVGGRSSSNYHTVNASQAMIQFPNTIEQIKLNNLKGGFNSPRITSCPSGALSNCGNLKTLDIRYNHLSSSTVNDILVELVLAGVDSTLTIQCEGNRKPTGLTDMSAADTGNSAVNSLLASGVTITFNTTGNSNWIWPST